jgi:hypothetical protein
MNYVFTQMGKMQVCISNTRFCAWRDMDRASWKHQATTQQPHLRMFCDPCLPTTTFIWFYNLVFAMLAIGIIQDSCINPNTLKS